jgi:hypothetical protein
VRVRVRVGWGRGRGRGRGRERGKAEEKRGGRGEGQREGKGAEVEGRHGWMVCDQKAGDDRGKVKEMYHGETQNSYASSCSPKKQRLLMVSLLGQFAHAMQVVW